MPTPLCEKMRLSYNFLILTRFQSVSISDMPLAVAALSKRVFMANPINKQTFSYIAGIL